MANSFTFDSVDMADHGLVITRCRLPFEQRADPLQLHDLAYGFDSYRPSLRLRLNVMITATTRAALITAMDSIKKALNSRSDASLSLDIYDDRYWLARFWRLVGNFRSPLLWRGDIDFICHDPMAYGNSAFSNNHNIDADPDTVAETTGGTGMIKPVYTLTAGEIIGEGTIKIENTDTDEELQWTGAVGNGEDLVIDCVHWLVTNNAVEDMTVSGQFPRLLPGQANNIKVTGFGALGALNIAYRNRYV